MKKTYKSEAMAAIHETAEGLTRIGVMSKSSLRKFDEMCLTPVQNFSPEEIKAIRDAACASQSVFARYIGVTSGLVSQWERGEKKPSGPARKLLSLAKAKGLEAIA